MKKYLLLLALSILTFDLSATPKEKFSYVKVSSSYGDIIIKLYNETPQHRDNFIKLAEKGFYDSLLFHRVISNFMIQGGDPDSKKAVAGQALGNGDVGYLVPAEINPKLAHKKGVLAAARDNNPAKSSSGCQFYIVQGQKFTDEQLDMLQKRNGWTYSPEQREAYKTLGGTPHLDNNYTVYGETVQGIEVVDKIAAVKTLPGDRPEVDLRMTVKVLRKKEVKKLEKSLKTKK